MHRLRWGELHHRAVVAAGDGDHQVLGVGAAVAVGDGDWDGQGLRFTGLEVLVIGVAGVEFVTAVGVEGEAVDRTGDAVGQVVAGVHVGGVHVAGQLVAVFSDALGLRLQHRGIVGAVDGNRDSVLRTVFGMHNHCICEVFPCAKLLNFRLVVVYGVAVMAVRLNDQLPAKCPGIANLG